MEFSISLSPQNYEELKASLEKYQSLAAVNTEGASMVYAEMPGKISVRSELLSEELLKVLHRAGWTESELWESDSKLYYLEDSFFDAYLNSCEEITSAVPFSAVLVNKYRNRTCWKKDADKLYPETSLLNPEGQDFDMEVYYRIVDGQVNPAQSIRPSMVSEQLPEGIDFTGVVSLILPLHQLDAVSSAVDHFRDIHVCGAFEDKDEGLFKRLQQQLGQNIPGQIRYTRKIFQEWYDSMSGIHLAMTSICVVLFCTVLLNIFSTMIFQYAERRKNLAVLWSLGQSERGLLKILVLENIQNFAVAVIIGIPAASGLCYYIYGVFRTVWCMDFVLPLRQLVLIIASAAGVSVIVFFLDWYLMKHQNFLQDIRDIT